MKKKSSKEPDKKSEGWKPNGDLSKAEAKAFTMSYTTEENLPPLERYIWDLRATRGMVGRHRTTLFWLLIASLVAHAIR